MYKFTRLNRGQKTLSAEDITDFAEVINLAGEFRGVLFDDVFYRVSRCDDSGRDERSMTSTTQATYGKAAQEQLAFIEAVAGLIEGAGRCFWVVKRKKDGVFAGFMYLYNFYGKTAFAGACFKREFWGEEVLKIGQKFLKHCFSRLALHKLKCETMHSNPYVNGFLRRMGFALEGVMEEDTFVDGKPENLLLWGLTASNFTFAPVGISAHGLDCPTSPSNGCGSCSVASSSTHGLRIKKRTLRALDYTSRSINNKVIVTDFSRGRKKD